MSDARAGWVSSSPRAERARRAAEVLRRDIAGGTFADGPLPDERVLGARLGVSRNAVRDALALLRDEGLITRRRGVGTMVVAPRYGHGLDRLEGLAETLAGHGAVTNEVRAAGRVADPPGGVAARLGLAPGEGAVRIERLRRLEGEPLSLDVSYLPADVGAAVLGLDLAGRDLFALIEEVAGQPLGRAEVTLDAVGAGPGPAALLGVAEGAAVFAVGRLTRLADGRPVDCEDIRIRADRLAFHATLYRGAAARREPEP
ncbi:GntR family transcriptional regulator [Actinomadura madurae]|uniref:GntR family transcriptional regulator n=1 Tax=Actinomadura madurae TaxID=1993 RepID=UPI000D9481EF|nr:GntR family transcriptional regulator [Actinomadura madurae]SPT64251.1 HTH-type transcriptional repressor yvoA [Actinomadura madurae]